MDTLHGLLSGASGSLPRRAVLDADGILRDQTDCPDRPEHELLSRCCEIVAAERGTPHPSRDHATLLLTQCLHTGCPRAWTAARNDILAGVVFDQEVVDRVDAAACVRALTATDAAPESVFVVSELLERSSADVTGALATSLGATSQFAAALDNALRAAATMHGVPGAAETCVLAFGRIVAAADFLPDRLAALAIEAVRGHGALGARPFLKARHLAEAASLRPQLVRLWFDVAEAAPPAHRYPPLAAMAIVARTKPDMFADWTELADLVTATLAAMLDGRGRLDVRLVAACAAVARATSGAGTLARAMARAAEALAASLLGQ